MHESVKYLSGMKNEKIVNLFISIPLGTFTTFFYMFIVYLDDYNS